MRETGPFTCVITGVVSKLLYATDSGVDTTDAVAADVSVEFGRLVRAYTFRGKPPRSLRTVVTPPPGGAARTF